MTFSANTTLARWTARAVFGMACLLVFSPLSRAQYNASLQGTVTDSEGLVVPGATITLTDTETNHVLTVTSRAAGDFNFNALSPSIYKLAASHAGFKTQQIENVKIISEQANTRNIQLQVGGATEVMTVNADEKALIDTSTGQISGTLSQEDIAKLPSYGRDVFQLVQLAPGVFGDGAQSVGGGSAGLAGNQGPGGSGSVFSVENRPQVSGNGGRTDQNNITLDGVGINSVTWAGAAVVTPSEDSVKELKVVANSYDAEFGRTSAAQIEAISQNGTNSYHGTAFFKADRPGLNAFQRRAFNGFNPQRNTARFNQFGGTVGGPILHNHVFAFFSYETTRNHSTTVGGDWYETPFIDGAAPSGSIASRFLGVKGNAPTYSRILEGPSDGHTCADINLVEGVSCHFIAGQGLDIGRPLTGVALGATDPSFQQHSKALPNGFPGLGGDGTGSPSNLDGKADIFFLETAAPFSSTSQQFNGRLDYQATTKDLIAFSIYRVPVDQTNFNGPSRPVNVFNHNQVNYAETALWDRTFSPTVLNEVRVNAAGWKWNELASNPQTPYGLPHIAISTVNNGAAIGSLDGNTGRNPPKFGANVGSIFDQATYSVKDKFTKVIGSHNLKLGGEGTKLEYLDYPIWAGSSTYYFNNLWDFLNDGPTAQNITADPVTGRPASFRKDTRQNLFSFFAQDDWKVKQNLTVTFGLRYEHFGSLYEKQDKISNLRLGTGSNVLSGARFEQGGNQVNAPKGNFGPQLGFAWSPEHFTNKLVLRGGFGLGYSGLEEAILTNSRFNPPYVSSSGTLFGSRIAYGTASDLYKPDSLTPNPNVVTKFDANGLPTALGVSINATGFPTNLPTAYNYRFSLEGQYDLGAHWVATLGYQGSLGRHLPLQTHLNEVYAAQVLAGRASFNPKLSDIDWYEDTGSSSFNALLAEVHHQFANTFELDTQYRWSKSLDNGSGPFTSPDYIFAPGYNYGPSDFDVRNMLKVWGVWSPHIFTGNYGWAEKIAGGWTLSGIVNLHSGFPWNPLYKGAGGNAVIPQSHDSDLRPARYLGGAGRSQSTDAFKKINGNFPNSTSSSGADGTYFSRPNVFVNPLTSWPTDGTAPKPVALPDVPGIGRNAFFGPRYFATDATVTKAFGLPNLPVLGESARFEIRGNAYNLFNQLNLTIPDSNVTDNNFGRATGAFAGRTIELEAHFKF